MNEAVAERPLIRTADGVPLKLKLRRTTRVSRLRAFLLVAPLLAFVTVTFVVPIGDMLLRSVHDPEVRELLPATMAALESWEAGEGPPEEPVFAALGRELVARAEERTLGKVALRMNFELAGSRTLLDKTARRLGELETTPDSYREAFLAIDEQWADIEAWAALERVGDPVTARFYLEAVDLRPDAYGDIVRQPEYRRIYVMLYGRTLWVSLLIAGLCLMLGYPIAYLMANTPVRTSNLLMILVLLPFWTSLLVRTTSWIVLLQRKGVVNDLLVSLGVIGDGERLQMIYNMTGTVIAMTHVLLPFMVLPLFSVMKTISPSHVRAAQSLGANPFRAFWSVYAPQTVPGVGAGCLLVFIIAMGYYITPALVGGRTGQLISNFIAYHVQQSLNWGLAAALGGLLLLGVLVLYWVYTRVVGVENIKLG